MKSKHLSLLLTLGLLLLLGLQWYTIHGRYLPNQNQLASEMDVTRFLESRVPDELRAGMRQVKVGMFISALQFANANDVEVAGTVWQRYDLSLEGFEPGVIFPDAVEPATLEQRYDSTIGNERLIGWQFNVTLRQAFDYANYPIDHKTVWIRLGHNYFNERLLFLPDLGAYEATSAGDTFGISESITLSGWDIEETFFDYMFSDFDTDFGLHDISNHRHIPVLAFNVVLNRQLFNAFMINITLLFVTMALLYILIIMITSDSDLKEEFDISVGGAVGSCSGLFFAILLAHIHLREQFPSAGFVYLEAFYILNYLFVLVTALVIFSFYNKGEGRRGLLLRDDARVLKLSFGPAYFLLANLYTWFHF